MEKLAKSDLAYWEGLFTLRVTGLNPDLFRRHLSVRGKKWKTLIQYYSSAATCVLVGMHSLKRYIVPRDKVQRQA